MPHATHDRIRGAGSHSGTTTNITSHTENAIGNAMSVCVVRKITNTMPERTELVPTELEIHITIRARHLFNKMFLVCQIARKLLSSSNCITSRPSPAATASRQGSRPRPAALATRHCSPTADVMPL